MTVLIVGASRGIGLEFVRQYCAQHHAVTATGRDEDALKRLRDLGASALQLDVLSADSVATLNRLECGQFDVVIICAGVGSKTATLDVPEAAAFDKVMHTNVLGPMRVVAAIAPAMKPGARLVLMSSQLGSIGSRLQAGNWIYRASKAALNSMLKDVSLALADRVVSVGIHPGWVRTDMGGADADIGVSESVCAMRGVIDKLMPSDNGTFRDYHGRPIPW